MAAQIILVSCIVRKILVLAASEVNAEDSDEKTQCKKGQFLTLFGSGCFFSLYMWDLDGYSLLLLRTALRIAENVTDSCRGSAIWMDIYLYSNEMPCCN